MWILPITELYALLRFDTPLIALKFCDSKFSQIALWAYFIEWFHGPNATPNSGCGILKPHPVLYFSNLRLGNHLVSENECWEGWSREASCSISQNLQCYATTVKVKVQSWVQLSASPLAHAEERPGV